MEGNKFSEMETFLKTFPLYKYSKLYTTAPKSLYIFKIKKVYEEM